MTAEIMGLMLETGDEGRKVAAIPLRTANGEERMALRFFRPLTEAEKLVGESEQKDVEVYIEGENRVLQIGIRVSTARTLLTVLQDVEKILQELLANNQLALSEKSDDPV